MKVFYLWLEWKGFNHAVFVFRATGKDAQAWFDNLPLSSPRDMYHLLECQDDPSVKTEFPTAEDLKKLSMSNHNSNSGADCGVQMLNNDGKYTRLTQLQEAFEIAFKQKQPIPDSRDVDGKSWRDRPTLF